jgi:hypothetical protein
MEQVISKKFLLIIFILLGIGGFFIFNIISAKLNLDINSAEEALLEIEKFKADCKIDSFYDKVYFPNNFKEIFEKSLSTNNSTIGSVFMMDIDKYKYSYFLFGPHFKNIKDITVLNKKILDKNNIYFKYLINYFDEAGAVNSSYTNEIYLIKTSKGWVINFGRQFEADLKKNRSMTKDARRVSDIKLIQSASELYFNERKEYPVSIYPNIINEINKTVYLQSTPNNEKYDEPSICKDEKQYIYNRAQDNKSYTLSYCLESDIGNIPIGNNVATKDKITQLVLPVSKLNDKILNKCSEVSNKYSEMLIKDVKERPKAETEEFKIRARDAQRISQIKQIQTALSMYFNEEEAYPSQIKPGEPIKSTKQILMNSVPNNPIPVGQNCIDNPEYFYKQTRSGSWYELIFCLESDFHKEKYGFNKGLNSVSPSDF